MKPEQSDIHPPYNANRGKVPWLLVVAATGCAVFLCALYVQVLGVEFSAAQWLTALALVGSAVGLKHALGQRRRGGGGRGR